MTLVLFIYKCFFYKNKYMISYLYKICENGMMDITRMKTKKVTVENYDIQWESDFKKIKLELETLIDKDVVSIEHVGSTSVKGLSAKSIIDIDIIIASMDEFLAIKQKLSVLGYIHEGNLGI